MPERALSGQGSIVVAAPCAMVWPTLLDPGTLAAIIPGAERVARAGSSGFKARIAFGVGFVRGRYDAELSVTNQQPPHRLTLAGQSGGAFGGGSASAEVTLAPLPHGRTRLDWRYAGRVSGPVAVFGRGLHQAAADLFVRRVFTALAKRLAAAPRPAGASPGGA